MAINPHNIIETLALNVKTHRLKNGWTQEELSFRCNLHKNYISDIECAKRNISLLSVSKIADGLKIKPSRLFLAIKPK